MNGSVTTPMLRTADYTVSSITFDALTSSNTYQIDGKLVELGQFRLTSPDRDSTFKAITLTNSGIADVAYLSDLVLQRNGITISSNVILGARTVTFLVNDDVLIGQNALYSVKGIIKNVDREGDSYQFRVKTTSDVNVVEKTTQFRSQFSSSSDYVMGSYVVRGADVRLITNA